MTDLTKRHARELVAAWEQCQSRADGADDEHDIAEQAIDLLREIGGTDMDETTYKIIRFHFDADQEVVETGLTLAEAQAHCRREDTHGEGWFDGYESEG